MPASSESAMVRSGLLAYRTSGCVTAWGARGALPERATDFIPILYPSHLISAGRSGRQVACAMGWAITRRSQVQILAPATTREASGDRASAVRHCRGPMRKLQSQGVHHITIVGADRQTSIDFWEGVLGMPFVFEQPNLDDSRRSSGDHGYHSRMTDRRSIPTARRKQWL